MVNHPAWPTLERSSDDRGRMLASAVFTRNHSWKDKRFGNFYLAVLGPRGARALLQGSNAVRPVLENNGEFRLLAVSRSGEDAVVVTDGRDAVLHSKSALGISTDAHPEGPLLSRLFQNSSAPRQSLEEWAGMMAPKPAATGSATSVPAISSLETSSLTTRERTAFRIVAYNLRCGGSKRHWESLISHAGPDLVLLQETMTPESLLEHENTAWHWHWRAVGRGAWGSAIVSRLPIRRPIDLPQYAGWVVGAEIEGPTILGGEPVVVISLHAPTRGGRTDYVAEVDRILDALAGIVQGRHLILGGDFNFRSLGDRAPKERDRTRADEARVLRRLREEFGLINCWQECHPGEALEQTLRWSGDKTIPYHCDGIFVSSKWRAVLSGSRILSGDSWTRLSDHNPVTVELAPRG